MLVSRGGKMNPNVYDALGSLSNKKGMGCVGCLGSVGSVSSNWLVWALALGAVWFVIKKKV